MMTNDDVLARAASVSDADLSGLDLGPAPRPDARRRKRLVAAGIGLTAAVAIGVPAAAGQLSARTGTPASGGEAGTSERIRLDAPDAPSVYAEYTARKELPPGGTWDEFLAHQAKVPADQAEASRDLVAQWVAWEARCQWERAWLRDVPGAQEQLEAMTTWPEFTGEQDAGGLGAQLLRDLVARTGDGDDTLLRQDVRANCR